MVHLTEIHNSEKMEQHLCEECAREKGVQEKLHFSIQEILGNMMESKVGEIVSRELSSLRCPRCGLTYKDFRSKTRFGCAHDYEVFREGIRPLLEKIHGSTTHVGKTPPGHEGRLKKENELLRLKRELDLAVRGEDYERAAKLRDAIKSAESREGNRA